MTGELLAIAAALWFAIGSLFVRLGNEHLDRSTGLVAALFANAFLVVAVAAGHAVIVGLSPIRWGAVAAFVAGGLASSFLARWLSIGSIEYLGPSRAAVVKNVQPVITAVLAVVILGETISLAAGLAAGIVVLGTMFTSGERISGAISAARWGIRPEVQARGVTLALFSAGGYSIANIFRKTGVEIWDEPLIGAAVGVIAATAGSLVLQRGSSKERPPGGDIRKGYLYFAAYGALAAASQICIFLALSTTDVWVVNLLVCTEPALTALLSWMVFRGREHFTFVTLMSISAVVVGSAAMVLL